MLVHPQFSPIALDLSKIGLPIAIHWYGITYLVAFGLFLDDEKKARTAVDDAIADGWRMTFDYVGDIHETADRRSG